MMRLCQTWKATRKLRAKMGLRTKAEKEMNMIANQMIANQTIAKSKRVATMQIPAKKITVTGMTMARPATPMKMVVTCPTSQSKEVRKEMTRMMERMRVDQRQTMWSEITTTCMIQV